MPAAIDTMAWTNEVPWHGLGVEVAGDLTAEQMLKAAQLDWEVQKNPLQACIGDKQIIDVPDQFALCRGDQVLDVVGKAYNPIQNSEAFGFFKEFVEAGDATMETAGSLHGGKMVWGLANMNKAFELKGGDQVKGYLLVAAPHQQGKSLICQATNIRVVCNNTLRMALRDSASAFRMVHRKKFDSSAIDMARETLGLARDRMGEFEQIAKRLSKKKVSEQRAVDYITVLADPQLLGVDKTLTSAVLMEKGNKMARTIFTALNSAPGYDLASSKGTAWGLINAVSYVTDHVIGRGQDQRLTKAWFGKYANLKEKAVELAEDI
jgi:phage/plasmid-like protein (TIGR03299 family)